MPVSAQERRFLLDQLNHLAAADVTALWNAAERLSGVDFARFIVDGFSDVVEPWIAAAGDMAAMWFEESVPGPASAADLVPSERLQSSAQWALGADGPEALSRLTGTTQRAVYDGARDTTLQNAIRTRTRWAREARPDACAFCRLLSTRKNLMLYRSTGIVFDEELGAFRTKVVSRQATQDAGDRYHDFCRCIAVEVPDLEAYELPEHAQQWQDEYDKAVAEAGGHNFKAILKAWRAQSADIK